MFYTITVKKFWVFKLRSQGAKLLFGQTILPCTKSSLLSKYPGWILVFTLKGLKGRRPSKIEVSKKLGVPEESTPMDYIAQMV